MIAHSPIKYLFQIGNLKVGSYGFMLFLSFAMGFLLALREGQRKKLDLNHISGLVLMTMMGSMVGARLIYCMEHLDRFLSHPGLFFNMSEGGLSSIGGIVGSTLFVFAYVKFQRLYFWSYVDAMVPSLCLGIFITRLGCFLNGCCYGIGSRLPWAVNGGDFARHPTQLYHSLSGVILFMVIWHLRKKERYAGILFPVFMVLYGPIRFFIEFLRDSQRYVFDLTAAQLLVLPLILISSIYLFWHGSNKNILPQG